MEISEIFPKDGTVQRNYCDKCGGNLDLQFGDFHEKLSGISIKIERLPTLVCEKCDQEYLPDRSRVSIIYLHEEAWKKGITTVVSPRQKINQDFGFTDVSFEYDADDYFYIPGLKRPHNEGFLTPVFFNKQVLLKYDASPVYRVRFTSPTYGEIWQGSDFSISFGVNKNGKIVMWLGDIARLPTSEQHYLRSENVESDNSIGSEFYDAQIECVFTQLSNEEELFQSRSNFLEACFLKYEVKFGHLDEEVLELAIDSRPPVINSDKEMRDTADILNKIYVESFSLKALSKVLKSLGGEPKDLGSLKLLQAIIEILTDKDVAYKSMGPLFVLYDLRVATSHLGSVDNKREILNSVKSRLGLDEKVELELLYLALVEELTVRFKELTGLVSSV